MQKVDYKLKQIVLAKRLNNVLQKQIKAENKNLTNEQVKHEMKNKVLELYLNYVFLGNNAYGVQAASKTYFGKGAKDLTVLDNVLIAFGNHHKPHTFASFFRLPAFYKNEEELKNKALDLLKIFDLDKEAETLAKNLAYGQQRRLEIVRALATEPKILFLDEPAAGMNPQETAELTELIRRIKNEFNITIMLIEHDMSLVMEVTERIYVLEYGRLIAHGTPDEIKSNERVIEAYLGGEA